MIPAENAHLHTAAKSHPGMSGKNNEDRYSVIAFYLEDEQQTPGVLAVVADGIGGHRGGEVAAEIAIDRINQVVMTSEGQQPTGFLQEAIIQAGQAIYEEAQTNPDLHGMGATCACCLVIANRLYTANVGDSRIYLLRGSEIRQLSIDHTWVQEALDQGTLTPEQAQGHPNSHVIRRYLGSRQPVIPDTRLRLEPNESDLQAESNQGIRLLPGDQLLLCSDGLTDLVEDEEIQAALRNYPVEEAIENLIEQANQRGGHDNITIVVLQMPSEAAPARTVPVAAPQRLQSLSPTCFGMIALVLVLAILAAGGLMWLFFTPILGGGPAPTHTAAASPAPGQAAPSTATIPALLPTLPGSSPQPGGNTPSLLDTPTGPPEFTLTPWPTNTRAP